MTTTTIPHVREDQQFRDTTAKAFLGLLRRDVTVLRKNARAVLGEDIQAHGVPLYTDARHYSAAGVPTVLYGAGPRTLAEANGHRADENLKLDDLYKATEVVALSLYDLLATRPTR